MRSLHSNVKDKEGRRRRNLTLHNIRALSAKYEVISLQETRMINSGNRELDTALKGWEWHHSISANRNRGGVSTGVGPTITAIYIVE